MLWDKNDVAKEIQEKFGIKYNPEKFTFARENWSKSQEDWGELLELWFVVEETQEIFKLPMRWNNLEAIKLLE